MPKSEDRSPPPRADKPKPIRHEPTALELASVAAAIDPVLSRENPSKAVHFAVELIRAAQERIAAEQLFPSGSPHSPFNEEENRETEEEACDRQARENLFTNGVTVFEAFEKWGSANGYKKHPGRFCAALRKAGLSYAIIGEGWSNVEMTSELAVKELSGWKKRHEQTLDNEGKKERRQRRNSKKITGNLEVKKGSPKPKKGR